MERHTETERTYDLTPDADVPNLSGGAVQVTGRARTVELRAIYYDTEDLALAAAHVTLRRRTGGSDAGWTAKLPGGGDSRREHHLPLGKGTRVPAELSSLLVSFSHGAALHPVVRLDTTRREQALRSVDGTTLAEVADDTVTATRLRPTRLVQAWRELEIELVDGGPEVLDEVEATLTDAGIRRSASESKLRRALGDAGAERLPARSGLPKGSAGALLHAYLVDRRAVLSAADLAVRTEGAGVHQVRVSARRLRTAVAVYRPLLDDDRARHLQRELTWLGRQLSDVRDNEVLRRTTRDDLGLGDDARDYVLARLDAVAGPSRAKAEKALSSRRYALLLAGLDALVAAPPWTARASDDAAKVMPKRVAKSLRRLARRAEAVGAGRDEVVELHDVRKAAKRLRYAAEIAAPELGKPATRLAASAEKTQTALGDFLDAVHLRDWLWTLAHDHGARTAVAFDLGRSYEREVRELSAREHAGRTSIRELRAGKPARHFG